MAKSNIIKELANSEIPIETSLKRLKILLMNFYKPELLEWVNSELSGYDPNCSLPDYRIIKGVVKGNFFVGFGQYKKVVFPIGWLDKDLREKIEYCYLYQSISSLSAETRKDNAHFISMHIPTGLYGKLTKGTNNTNVLSAWTEISMTSVVDMIAKIENRILDILILLENEFGVLDELDIDVYSKSDEENEKTVQKIINIIYQDNSIKIGDKNEFNKSEISTSGGCEDDKGT